MKCPVCKGTGKVEDEDYVAPSGTVFEGQGQMDCPACGGKGERNIVLTITLWDEDNEKEITSETVPTISFEQGCEAVSRMVNNAPELLKEN